MEISAIYGFEMCAGIVMVSSREVRGRKRKRRFETLIGAGKPRYGASAASPDVPPAVLGEILGVT